MSKCDKCGKEKSYSPILECEICEVCTDKKILVVAANRAGHLRRIGFGYTIYKIIQDNNKFPIASFVLCYRENEQEALDYVAKLPHEENVLYSIRYGTFE